MMCIITHRDRSTSFTSIKSNITNYSNSFTNINTHILNVLRSKIEIKVSIPKFNIINNVFAKAFTSIEIYKIINFVYYFG